MSILIKHFDPTLHEFSTDELVVNVRSGSLFYKSRNKLYRLRGDDISTTGSIEGEGVWTQTPTNPNNIYYDSGNVGIFTETPTAPLHVIGSISSSGISSSGNITAIGNITGNSGSLNYLEVAGNISASGNIMNTNGGYYNLSSSGNLLLNGIGSSPGATSVAPGRVLLGTHSTTNTGSLAIHTDAGYLYAGPRNSSFCHFYTDINQFYFNKKIVVNTGIVNSYNGDLILRRDYNDTSYNQITIGDDSLEVKLDDTKRLSIDGNGFVGIGDHTPGFQLHLKSTIGEIELEGSTAAEFNFHHNGAAAGARRCRFTAIGGNFKFETLNDADTAVSSSVIQIPMNTTTYGKVGINTDPTYSFEVHDLPAYGSYCAHIKNFNNFNRGSWNEQENELWEYTSVLKLTTGHSYGPGEQYSEEGDGYIRFLGFYQGTERVGSIWYNGNEGTGTTTSASDVKLKDNVRPTKNPKLSIDNLMKLEVVDFEWKKNGKTDSGFIAQDLKKVYPKGVISYDKENEHKGLTTAEEDYNYMHLTNEAPHPLLTKAIQDQQKQIESLEKRIKTLEIKVNNK